MFTGLIQQLGRVVQLDDKTLWIKASAPESDPWIIGESVAVNGCCLTVVSSDPHLRFDLSQETLDRTNIGCLKPNEPVNIERAMKAGDRFGGHIVQGHVDTIGKLIAVDGNTYTFAVPLEGDSYLIDKGSIAIDGISLTLVKPGGAQFQVALIPHTLAETNLHTRQPGDPVNIEYDVIAKHVEKLLAVR
jgi:riboflavin synthase